jgi:polar amino acid transport system ATP-binding protein
MTLLERADTGCIEIDGETIWSADGNETDQDKIWPRVTLVFQQLHLWPHLTLRSNILLPLRLARCESLGQFSALVNLFSMESFIDRHPNEVSIGQRQLCAFVRAVCLCPSYLFLDEITSALDVEYTAKLLKCIRELRDEGMAILLTSHLIGFAKKSADRVLFLEGGVIVESGESSIIESPSTDRFREFLSMVMEAR